MKRHNHLFEKIVSLNNLELAYRNSRKGKTWQDKIKNFNENWESNLQKIHYDLVNGRFKTSEYRVKTITEPKKRIIYILPFSPDRIVQHAIVQVLEPIWDSLFIQKSFACRKNLGIHKASSYTQDCVRRNKYYLQMDISKFYPSIDHEILFRIVSKKIKCKKTLELLEGIIRSEKGCPIGNYTSQWFGNLYLNELDQHIKRTYKVKDYCRYVDDFLLFDDDKERLQYLRINIVEFLRRELKLSISRWCLRPTRIGVDFVGYRHFPNKKLLRKSTSLQMRRRIKTLRSRWPECSSIRFRSTLASYEGWAKWAQTSNFRKQLEIQSLKEFIGMRGKPKHLNTKFDYEFIRKNNYAGWQKEYQKLLNGYMAWQTIAFLEEGEEGIENETYRIHVQTEKDLETNEEKTTRVQLEWKVDPKCKLLRLGFTKEEVETALQE